jgi:ABC-type ATPase with predicted acetyltransferase domain
MSKQKDSTRSVRVSARVRRRKPRGGHARAAGRVFGLAQGQTETLYDDFELMIPRGITAIVGPSGSGKSVLLERLVHKHPRARPLEIEGLSDCELPAIDAVSDRATLPERLDALSRCGLAEAATMITPARRLSAGQMHRLILARAMIECEQGDVLVADEFGGPLDPPTGEVVSEVFARTIDARQMSAVVATHRWELLPILRPAQVIVKPIGGAAKKLTPRWPGSPERRWRIRRGTIKDYHRLSRFHYVAGPPAAHKRVYVIPAPRAHRRFGGVSIAAVAVVSPPVLYCRGRNLISAGRYRSCKGRSTTGRLNAEVECISRVVVHPIYRGLGLASKLVRHILRTTPMPVVESLAVMGRYHPFLAAGGMMATLDPAMRYVYFSHLKTPADTVRTEEHHE